MDKMSKAEEIYLKIQMALFLQEVKKKYPSLLSDERQQKLKELEQKCEDKDCHYECISGFGRCPILDEDYLIRYGNAEKGKTEEAI